jgi:hypothetical protein
LAGRPPFFGAGMKRETWAHWGPVKSLRIRYASVHTARLGHLF